MAKLTQSPLITGSSASLSVELEVLPSSTPGARSTSLKARFYFGPRLVLEMESGISLDLAREPLEWLESGVKTRIKHRTCSFSDFDTPHVLVIDQYRLPDNEFKDIQAELGKDVFAIPFLYDINVLVNPEPETLGYCGLGMRLSGFSYVELHDFLIQLDADVKAALK